MGQLYYHDGSLVTWPLPSTNPFLGIGFGLATLNSPKIAETSAVSTVPSPYREKLLALNSANQAAWGVGTSSYQGIGPVGIGDENAVITIGLSLASPAGLSSFLNPPAPGNPLPSGVISVGVDALWNNQNAWTGLKFFGTQGYWPPPRANTDYPVPTTNVISRVAAYGDGNFGNFNYSSSPPGSLFPDINVSQLLIGINIVAIPTNLPGNLWTPYVPNSGDGQSSYAQAPLYYYAWGIKILEVADFSQPTLRVLSQSPFFYPGDSKGLQVIDGGDIVTAYGTEAFPVLPSPTISSGVPFYPVQGGEPGTVFNTVGAWFKNINLPDSLLVQTNTSSGIYGWATGLNPDGFTNFLVPVVFDFVPAWFAAGYFATKAAPYVCPIQAAPDPLIQRPTLMAASSPALPVVQALSPLEPMPYNSSSFVLYGKISPALGPPSELPNANSLPVWQMKTPKSYQIYPSGRLVQNKVYFGNSVPGQLVNSNGQNSFTLVNSTITPAFGINGSFAKPIMEIPMTGEKTYKLYLAL